MNKKLFVVGTGTDVGKTYVSALIVKKALESGARIGYFKAATSGYGYDANGRAISGEALFIKEFSGLTQDVVSACPFNYAHAVSPHLAARLESRPYDQSVVDRAFADVCARYDFTLIEASGGIYCPLRMEGDERILILDLIQRWNAPALIVTDSGLGAINVATLTARALRDAGVKTVGFAFNRFREHDVMHTDNVKTTEALTDLKALILIPENAQNIETSTETVLNWFE